MIQIKEEFHPLSAKNGRLQRMNKGGASQLKKSYAADEYTHSERSGGWGGIFSVD